MFGKAPKFVCNNATIYSILEQILPRYQYINMPIIVYVGNDPIKREKYIFRHMSRKEIGIFKGENITPRELDALAWTVSIAPMQKQLIFINSEEWTRVFHAKNEMVGCLAHELAHIELQSDSNILIQLSPKLSEQVEASKFSTQHFHGGGNYRNALTLNEYVADALAIGRGFANELSACFRVLETVRGSTRSGIPYEIIDEESHITEKVSYMIAKKGETLRTTGVISLSDEREFYCGDVKDGILEGECKKSIRDAVFVGRIEGSNPKSGVMLYDNGDIYTGSFRSSRREGYGRCYYESGETYDGAWVDDLYHGYGVLYDAAGKVWQAGAWKCGRPAKKSKKTGACFGTVSSSNKNGPCRYCGDLKNGKYHGEGILKTTLSASIGEFSDGQFVKGTIYMNNGQIYTGQSKDNCADEQGRLYYPDGSIYDGEFRGGHCHGQGVLYGIDGSIQSGVWENGEAVDVSISNKAN